jgi:hypothetical protein
MVGIVEVIIFLVVVVFIVWAKKIGYPDYKAKRAKQKQENTPKPKKPTIIVPPTDKEPDPVITPPVEPEPVESPRQELSGHIPFDINKVKWLHKNISKWPETSLLKNVSISANRISFSNSKGEFWPAVVAYGVMVNANLWCFVEIKGVWYGATFEHLRPDQQNKVIGFKGIPSHTKASPIKDFKLRSGDIIYTMTSGLARNPAHTNIQERSNIVAVTLK